MSESVAVAMRPGRNGGQLKSGNPGHKGGPGAPPSVVREMLRGSFVERVKTLESIADGECVQRAQVPLYLVLPHATCPTCDGRVRAKEPDAAILVSVTGKVSASPADRTRAIDLLAKYGLGTIREVSTDDVRERLKLTLGTLREQLPADQAERVIKAIEAHWK